MADYNFQKITQDLNKLHDERNDFYCDVSKDGYYALGMFPYPSGDAHMGHVLVYTLTDVMARYRRLHGKQVMNPMGWDAFGLPAENAAIKNKVHPSDWTEKNIAKMKSEQFPGMGWCFDWSKEINSSAEDYYRWSQWIFLQFYKHGKAYKKSSLVNWCEVDQTVLANEQVIDGRCWRDGSVVQKKEMEQWFLRLTDYAERLWDDLPKLKNWASEAVAVQKNWINKSTGVEAVFTMEEGGEPIPVFTTRADTIFGVQALVLAPEHKLVKKIQSLKENPALNEYVDTAIKKSAVERMENLEKTGVPTGFYCKHPLREERIEIWVGDYVIADFGTGAVMCVPAHDVRDYAFAKQFNLRVVEVVKDPSGKSDLSKDAYTDEGKLVNSEAFDGLKSEEARDKIAAALEEKKLGNACVNFNLRDWSVGRQRYWGCPIPIIYCEDCGDVPVPEDQLPVCLPKDIDMEDGKVNLKTHEGFIQTICPKCGKPARRETDTLDTFLCSSWYAFRFLDPKNEAKVFDSEIINRWMPLDFYVGGLEHAALHMIYFRFFTKFFHDIGLIDFDEPVDHFFCNGMVCYKGSKMSKSKGNVIIPTEMIEKYGADTIRLYVLSDTPAEQNQDWDDSGIKAKFDFVRKNYRNLSEFLEKVQTVDHRKMDLAKYSDQDALFAIYEAMRQFEFNVNALQFHNTVAKTHEMSNILLRQINKHSAIENDQAVLKHLCRQFLTMVSCLMPYFSEDLVHKYFDVEVSIFKDKWPDFPDAYQKKPTINVAVQVNGKKRAVMELNRDATQAEVEPLVIAHEAVQNALEGKKLIKFIYVPNKIVNLVIK